MKFELKLDMYNAEQEAVWLHDFLHQEGLEDLDVHVVEGKPEPGTLDGGVLMPILAGVATGIISTRIEWLITKIWAHFYGKKGRIDFHATCPAGGASFTMSFELGNETERDEAQAEFKRRFEAFCKPSQAQA